MIFLETRVDLIWVMFWTFGSLKRSLEAVEWNMEHDHEDCQECAAAETDHGKAHEWPLWQIH